MFRRLIFRRFYIPKYEVLCSEDPIFRRSYIQKVLYSEGSIFRRSCVPKNWKVLYSEGSTFRNFGFCSLSSSDAVVDDMDEIVRWVGVGVKIKKSGNVEITACGD